MRVQAMYRGHVVRAEAEAEALEKRRAECAVKLQALGAPQEPAARWPEMTRDDPEMIRD